MICTCLSSTDGENAEEKIKKTTLLNAIISRLGIVAEFDANENSDVYYTGQYWNDIEFVDAKLRNKISEEYSLYWWMKFQAEHPEGFNKALFLNCGNGWVERELVSSGFIRSAVGIDYSQDLLDAAVREAKEQHLPIEYIQMNVNEVPLPNDGFDLVVNFAAAHHIARIDKVFREICTFLPDDGWFLSYDYVGPHRNQYRVDAWSRVHEVNDLLPLEMKAEIRYPHLPTMMVSDPTEAIHSELILETMNRYFEVNDFVPLGGAIAYPLLTHNSNFFKSGDYELQLSTVRKIMEADEDFLDRVPESTLFAYFAAQPKKDVLRDEVQLGEWERAEAQREISSKSNCGEYYPRNVITSYSIEIEEKRNMIDLLNSDNSKLRDEVLGLQQRRAVRFANYLQKFWIARLIRKSF